jgi:hypothetical protein
LLERRLCGQAAKRGLIPRIPSADRLLADIETWLREEYPDMVRAIATHPGAAGEGTERHVALHPAAPDLRLAADDLGRVTVSAVTIPTGPGYHTFVARLLERLGEGHAIEWEAPLDADVDPVLGAGLLTLASGDRPTAERAHLAWLHSTLAAASAARRRGARGIHIGTPGDVIFSVDEAIATALGPRDDAWLERALVEPSVAIEITPWWADAMGARYLLDRANCLLWTHVRWRSPGDEAERAVDDEALRLLRRALPLDPDLPFPWAAWLELIELRGFEEPMIEQIRGRAAAGVNPAPGDPDSAIGYRRRPVTIEHEGWTLEVPGSFAERRTAEEWWGGEGGRNVTIAAVETAANGRPMAASTFLDQVAGDLGAEALGHAEGPILGRARLGMDGSSGVGTGVLDGFSAVTGRGAAIRVQFDDAADWQWAIDMWRALRPVAIA